MCVLVGSLTKLGLVHVNIVCHLSVNLRLGQKAVTDLSHDAWYKCFDNSLSKLKIVWVHWLMWNN